MITYNIGTVAEKIVTAVIDRTGAITLVLCHRRADGSLCESVGPFCAPAADRASVDFVVRVEQGHSGVVEIRPIACSSSHACTLIPLGADRPFLESELPPSPGADGAYSQSAAIKFHFAAQVLDWTTENLSGRIELTERTPSVSVALRLPAGNIGEIVSPKPVFFTSAAGCVATLSIA